MTAVAVAALVLAALLDLLVAELPERVHPVAVFGRVVGRFDRSWRHPRAAGVAVALVLPLAAAAVLGGVVALALDAGPLAGVLVGGVVLFTTFSLRMLLSVAREVTDLTTTDLDRAREEVRALVGRDATDLSPAEVRSAAVESAAENLADGLVAPLAAFALGAQVTLAVGVGAAVWVKAVNTLDSMLGYETKPVGWASARLDDVVMWVPARLSAALIGLAARDPGAVAAARSWAGAPPSPNSGWPIATLAVALDVQLRKPGAYAVAPTGGLPTAEQAHRGVRVVALAGVLAVATAGVVAWY